MAPASAPATKQADRLPPAAEKDIDEDELAARQFAASVNHPSMVSNPAPAAADKPVPMEEDGEFMAIKQKYYGHPLGPRGKRTLGFLPYFNRTFGFVPYHLDTKCCVTNRDAKANPKTAVEMSILIFETHGDRFTVVNYPTHQELFVCDIRTKVWSKEPSAISSFLIETCQYDYYLGSDGGKVFSFQTKEQQDEVLRCLLVFNNIPSCIWNELVNKIPYGLVACADGFWNASNAHGLDRYPTGILNDMDVEGIDPHHGTMLGLPSDVQMTWHTCAYDAGDFITSDVVDVTMPMPYTTRCIEAEESVDEDGDPVKGEDRYEIDKWVIPKAHGNGYMYDQCDGDMRKIFPDPIMRKGILSLLSKAIFSIDGGYFGPQHQHPNKVLILTGAGRDGKEDLMDFLRTLFPHQVTISDGCFTTSATTRIACMRIERNGDSRVDVHELKRMMDKAILPVILMTTRVADETVTFSDPNLDLLRGRIAAFHMPSRFDPLAPRDGTEIAILNYLEEKAVPPRDAHESTNTYEMHLLTDYEYKKPAGKYAVYKMLARWAAMGQLTYADYLYKNHPSAKTFVRLDHASVYETTHLYTPMTELDSGVYGPHGNAQLGQVYARAIDIVTESDSGSKVPLTHIKWALQAADVPIAVRGFSTKVINERLQAYGGTKIADQHLVGVKLKPKYAGIVKKRVDKEAERKRIKEKNEAARLRAIEEKQQRLAEEAAAKATAEEAKSDEGEEEEGVSDVDESED